MAPVITHFMVGASLLLLAVAPVALRSAFVRRWGLWLIPIGGVWGLVPDVHHVTPVFEAGFRQIHYSPRADVFALHYTLDLPAVRERYLASIAASILLFCVAVGVFSLGKELGERDLAVRSAVNRTGIGVLATAVAAGYAGGALAIVVQTTHGIRTVAALSGRESLLVAVALLGALSLVGGAVFAALLVLVVPADRACRPVAGAAYGVGFGIVAWLVSVAVGVPVWMALAFDTALPVPYVDWLSLVALGVFGAVFGGVHALVVEAVGNPPASGVTSA